MYDRMYQIRGAALNANDTAMEPNHAEESWHVPKLIIHQNTENATLKCPNCSGPHAAYSCARAKFKAEKDIIHIKVNENITFAEARQKHKLLSALSCADAARQGVGASFGQHSNTVQPSCWCAAGPAHKLMLNSTA